MTKEELFEQAKLLYPIGTVFKDAVSGKEYTVDRYDDSNSNEWISTDYIITWCKGISGQGQYLYYKGAWAVIISKPESVIINDYQIF